MLNTFIEGFFLIFEYKLEISLFLLTVWAGSVVTINAGLFDETEGLIKYTAALCAGFLILTGVTFVISLLSLISQTLFQAGCYFILLCSAFILINDVFTNGVKLEKIKLSFGSTLLFILLLIIRLPYLEKILLPGYSDSPIHYQVIHQILSPTDELHPKLAIANIFENYYHFGYHSLTGWLSVVSGSSIARSMSLIGQISLALAPLSIAAATYTLSKNKTGAVLAGVLAALGWVMPAFAVNWGKFPALTALSTAPVLLVFTMFTGGTEGKSRASLFLTALLIVCSIIIHTRIIVLIALAGITIFIIRALKFPAQFELSRTILYSLLFIITLVPLSENIQTYFNRPVLGVILILLLPFAFRNYSKQSSGLIIFIAGLWSIELFLSFISDEAALLDTQFINMSLFIPFSILGGMGITGGIKQIPTLLKPFYLFAIIFIICYNSPWQATLIPDPCCTFYTEDDEIAFQWIQANTKEEDLFIISTINDKQQHGTDAGVWIHTLTGRSTNKRVFNTDWNINEWFPNSCNSGTKDIFIYSGGKSYSFSPGKLEDVIWVERIFQNGRINIFQVLQCSSHKNQEGR